MKTRAGWRSLLHVRNWWLCMALCVTSAVCPLQRRCCPTTSMFDAYVVLLCPTGAAKTAVRCNRAAQPTRAGRERAAAATSCRVCERLSLRKDLQKQRVHRAL